ncbi:hypothetical protein N480_05800 [Pseudoalteromonas luteoviolacea S2607]|uniref:Uncharacterized protein n=1 Tax=Pseudoalteromonas luteoviolacea S4060-1 TaxID=1365257 RepID=A0A161YJE8_9GAMM|nr:hypothetical protein N480_05800 [Pseudoalteromonas luteoviolacea S2607]KZN61360.1 hypothetical protein N478_04650 [Pseudoalteromonas luteoviolacea S4060-1]
MLVECMAKIYVDGLVGPSLSLYSQNIICAKIVQSYFQRLPMFILGLAVTPYNVFRAHV